MLKVSVRVIPRASKDKVEYFDDLKLLKVWTTAPPVDGKANEAVINAVAMYLSVNKKCVQISSGLAGKNKILSVNADISKEELNKKPRLF